MKSIKLSSSQKTIALIAGLVFVALFMYCAIPPLINKVMASKFKDIATVQKAVTTQFPEKKVAVSQRTTPGSTNSGTRDHFLVVTISGKHFLTAEEINDAKSIICDTLGDNARGYTSINLLNSVEHRFLMFYSRHGNTDSFTCE